MITVNNRPMEYLEGMTIQTILDKLKYTYPVLTIRINGVLLEENARNTAVSDGDKVEIIHPVLGG